MTAEAAFKAVGRALQAAVRAEGGGHPLDEGDHVTIAVCDYGAGNVRSVLSALERIGCRAS